MSDVRELPRTGWVAERNDRQVESPPSALAAAPGPPAMVVERVIRGWRFTAEVPAAIPGAQLGVPFGPVEGADCDGVAWTAGRAVLTEAVELPGGGVRYTAVSDGPVTGWRKSPVPRA